MNSTTTRRRLLFHGMLVFLFGLLAGIATPYLVNPRMGLAAHVGAVLSGIFLALVGLIWEEFRLSPAASKVAFWLFLYATHTGWLAQFLAGVFGTSRATPIGGAGFQGTLWQEALVYVLAASFSLAVLAASVLALWGLRKSATAPNPGDHPC